MPDYERRVVSGSFYLRCRETGRRTRCYVSFEACYRAAARGDLLTDEEYAAYRAGPVAAAPRRALNRKRGADA